MKNYIGALGFVGVLGLVGCQKSPEPFEGSPTQEGGAPEGWQQVPPADEPVEATGPLAEVPEAATPEAPLAIAQAMDTVRNAAERLRTAEDTDHAALIEGINALADAVYGLQGVEDKEALRGNIRGYTDRIRTSDPASTEHAQWAKAAMTEATRALKKVGNARNLEGFDDRIAQVDAQIDAIAADRMLLDQRVAVAAALDQMADALQELSTNERGTR